MAVMAIYPPFFTHILPVLHLTQERHRKGGGRMHAVSGQLSSVPWQKLPQALWFDYDY